MWTISPREGRFVAENQSSEISVEIAPNGLAVLPLPRLLPPSLDEPATLESRGHGLASQVIRNSDEVTPSADEVIQFVNEVVHFADEKTRNSDELTQSANEMT